ncbi:putative Voltage and ligand gated potassium channel [Operophtera brumata]|uniref:Putative Voltage and ligand gated potassium channel n=1 Tax=Operophtera brumata TaxID=104452 RepID=A0A0L7LFG2_OPEBR|nr:putative Voltage and ligand gated potassium channel [Operophtera brumata]
MFYFYWIVILVYLLSLNSLRFVTCYSLALLVLSFRSNNVFQHGVSQLRKFLNAERVEKTLIDKASAHFTYWWTRTKGVNIHHLINERIGVVLRQDLNYYFFKTTFTALDTLLLGGELLSQQLACSSTTIFVLPGHEIIRENDISSHVYVVHRGKVIISQDGEKVITLTKVTMLLLLDVIVSVSGVFCPVRVLKASPMIVGVEKQRVHTKGCIFGQLNSASNHPVRVSAISDGYADLLQIHVKQFQGIIDDEVKNQIL